MTVSNYSVLEEELIASHIQHILKVFNVRHYLSDRVGVEVSMQNGKVCGSNLNFYKTRPENLGNINCIVPPFSVQDKEVLKTCTLGIMKTLQLEIPKDIFGTIEVITEFDPDKKMRIKNVSVNLRSVFKLIPPTPL